MSQAIDAAARVLLGLPADEVGDVFRSGQREIIEAVTQDGHSVLAVLPTGGGKTLTVTVPVMAGHPEHGSQMAIVVVPLQAIMIQVVEDINRSIPCTDGQCPTAVHTPITNSGEYIDGVEVADVESLEVKDGARLYKKGTVSWAMLHEPTLRFIVTTPETLRGKGVNSTALRAAAVELISLRKLLLFGIDECHLLLCKDPTFRPLYAVVADVLLGLIDAGMARQTTTEGSPRFFESHWRNRGMATTS